MPQDRRKEANTSDRISSLRANEVILRANLETAEPHHVAALARELRATVREIADLESRMTSEVSLADQLAAKRAAKLDAAGGPPASRRGQPRRVGRSDRTG